MDLWVWWYGSGKVGTRLCDEMACVCCECVEFFIGPVGSPVIWVRGVPRMLEVVGSFVTVVSGSVLVRFLVSSVVGKLDGCNLDSVW